MGKQNDQEVKPKRPWWVKVTYPLGIFFMVVFFVVALLIKLIMVCVYPIGALAGVLLGGGKPGWIEYKDMIKNLL